MIALHDFTSAYPVELEWIAHRKNPANLPSQVFGRMRRTAFELDNKSQAQGYNSQARDS